MRVPLFTDDSAAKKIITKRAFLGFNCFELCQRRVKACLSVLFCLALLFILLYLDIVAIIFCDSLLRHSPNRVLPLSSFKTKQGKMKPIKYSLITFNETAKLEARNRQLG
jgi:hypothetical protein